jgi:phosphogluconate dehydratase
MRFPEVTPLMAKVYPNGGADINHFQAAGGTGLLFGELIEAGLMHGDAAVCFGGTLETACIEPFLEEGSLQWRPPPKRVSIPKSFGQQADAFHPEGGIRLLQGNLGRSLIKTSAVAPERQSITAPAVVISDQDGAEGPVSSGVSWIGIASLSPVFRVLRLMACQSCIS